MCVRIDEDDPQRAAYEAIAYPEHFELVIGKRPDGGGSAALIRDFYETHPDLDWYGLLADDVTPLGFQWDKKLVEAAGKSRMAYGPDGICNKSCATHPVIGGDLVREIGWLALPGVRHYFIDVALFQTVQSAGLITYVPDAAIRHDTQAQHTRSGWALEDRLAFNHFQRGGPMKALIERLRVRFVKDKDGGVLNLSVISIIPPDRQCLLDWTLGLMRLRELLGIESLSHQFLFLQGPITEKDVLAQVRERTTSTHVAYLDARAGFDAEQLVRDALDGKWSDMLKPMEDA